MTTYEKVIALQNMDGFYPMNSEFPCCWQIKGMPNLSFCCEGEVVKWLLGQWSVSFEEVLGLNMPNEIRDQLLFNLDLFV